MNALIVEGQLFKKESNTGPTINANSGPISKHTSQGATLEKAMLLISVTTNFKLVLFMYHCQELEL